MLCRRQVTLVTLLDKLVSHVASHLGLVDSMLINYRLGHIGKEK